MPDLRVTILFAGLGVSLGALAESGDHPLRTNPFLKPAFLSAQSGSVQVDKVDPVTLELRATMVAGQLSQANIGGTIIGLGEEVNGYRLLEVHARRVVLERDGVHKEITIEDSKSAGRD